ncbi:MAG: alkaline phosphatase family protein [Armatimonadota bacterium]
MRRFAAIVCIMLVSAVLPGSVGADDPRAQAAILFSSDGMRPDLVQRYARGGFLPTMADLLRRGVRGDNGLVPALPPNTGAGWTTLVTGAWTGVHGSTNNTFYETGLPPSGMLAGFQRDVSAFAAGVVQADTLGEAAERAGKSAVFLEWPASRFFSSPPRNFKGPAIDFRSFFSRRGIITNFDLPGVNCAALANSNPQCTRVTLVPATGWINEPASERPALETTLSVVTTFAAKNPTRNYFLYIFDSTMDGVVNYDKVVVATARDIQTFVAKLQPGQGFVEVKVQLTVTMTDARRAAGLYLKLIDMTPNLSQFRIHFTSIARVNANQPALEEFLASEFPTTQAADFAPLEAGLIPEEVYAEGGLLWEHSHWPILEHLVVTYRPEVLMLGTPLTDEFQHQFLALVTPGTPVFDDANRDGVPDGRVAAREALIRRAYQSADMTLKRAMDHMNAFVAEPAVFVSADHGFAPTWRTVNADRVLFEAGLTPDPDVAPLTSNCRPARATDRVKACTSGATAQIYINLQGRDNPGVVPVAEYDNVRQQIVKAFAGLRDGGVRVVDRIFLKEDLERIRIGGRIQNVTHPTRTGDVVVILKAPGYQFTAAVRRFTIADNNVFGQHGFWPDAVNLRRNVNLHSTFIMAGPGIRSGVVLRRVAMVDVAPTVAAVLGIDPPLNSQGRVLRRGLINP